MAELNLYVNRAEQLSDAADRAISAHTVAGKEYAALCGEELTLEADRAEQKLAAILRIMATTNDLTGNPHSASSAEKIVELDSEYRAYLQRQSNTVVMKNVAFTAAQSARLMAELSIARFRAEAGLR
jgi:hypothetical protein